MKDVIIVSSFRSGTRRVQGAFGQAKIAAAWESDQRLTISAFMAADVDIYAGKHKPWWDRHVDEVWHQTRSPLHCIAAMADVTPHGIWSWQYPITGLHPRKYRTRREFCSKFWVRWNGLCEERNPVWRYRVEDFEKVWPEMWKRLDLGEAPEIDPRSTELDGSAKREPMTWEELRSYGSVYDDVKRLAERYGYE